MPNEFIESHEETIICPECDRVQTAAAGLRPGAPFWDCVHTCEGCGYIIMESEWQPVYDDPFFVFGEWAKAHGYDLENDAQRAAAISVYGMEVQ